MNSGLETYKMYISIKRYFLDNYDIVKYKHKIKVTEDYFLSRKDRYSFVKLASKFSIDETRDYIFANFVNGDVHWVGELVGAEGEDVYRKWLKTKQSLTYIFENDIIHLMDSVESPNELLIVPEGRFPVLLTETMGGRISLETLIILNSLLNFFPMWEDNIEDDIVWPRYSLKCKKYKPFLKFDAVKFKQILLKHVRI